MDKVLMSYDLHDSSVMCVRYSPIENQLEILVRLCLWRQPGYVEGQDPEVVLQPMLFAEVTSFSMTSLDGLALCQREIRTITATKTEVGTLVQITLGAFENGRAEAKFSFTANMIVLPPWTAIED